MPLILPSNTERVAPEWFIKLLKETDPNLVCYFNQMKGRWVIDRCARDGQMSTVVHTHTPECLMTNVLIVEDAGQYMPLCDQVIDQIRSKDSWNYSSYEEFHNSNGRKAELDKAKRAKATSDLYKEASADNKKLLTQAWTLASRHDIKRPNR